MRLSVKYWRIELNGIKLVWEERNKQKTKLL